MDLSAANNYPRLCFESGLTCEACTAGTARELARVCKGLRGKTIGQLFVNIHAHPACAPMHAHFAECYRSHTEEESGLERFPRKPAAMAAVA